MNVYVIYTKLVYILYLRHSKEYILYYQLWSRISQLLLMLFIYIYIYIYILYNRIYFIIIKHNF